MCKHSKTHSSRSVFTVFALTALLALAAGCQEEKPKQQMSAPQVGVTVLEARHVPSVIELAGRVASNITAEVRPQVNGIILRRMFEEGSEVVAGQQLYQIDPAIYQAQYDTARADELRAQSAMDDAKKIRDRYAEIVKVRGVSQQEYDTATSTYNQSVAALAAAKAAVKTAKINLDYTRVYSPVSGRAGISSVTEGALVTASQISPLVFVQQMDPMYIDVTQSSADFLRLQRALKGGTMSGGGATGEDGKEVNILDVRLTLEDGQPYIKYENGGAVLGADGKPEQHIAKMLLYDATVDRGTGSITMRAIVDNPQHMLLPGMFVRAMVTEGVIENALLVPFECVLRTARGEAQVKIVNKEGKVEERIIESNRTYGGRFWIVLPGFNGNTKGIEIGDRLIVEGLTRVRAGMPVQTYPAGSKPAQEKPTPAAS